MVTGHTLKQQTSIRQIANRTSQGSNHFLLWRFVCVQSESDFYSLYVSQRKNDVPEPHGLQNCKRFIW